MARSSYLFTSESVSEGHPDKVCDRISDRIVDEYYRAAAKEGMDPLQVRVAVETLATTNFVCLAGEVRGPEITREQFNKFVRQEVEQIGYKQDGFHHANLEVVSRVHQQSADIAQGVDAAGDKDVGAGDQGIMFGFATDETPELMPAPIIYSHQILKEMARLRKSGERPEFEPDAKSQVTLRYDSDGKPVEVTSVVVSTQHRDGVSLDDIREMVRPVVKQVLPEGWFPPEDEFYVNPTGKFVIGGPDGDAGLTGRKIIVDTYGGAAPHGGGAFSGKDPTKVDRSAAYVARYLAKNVVAAGLARKCTIQLSYAIGVAKPLSVYVDTQGTAQVDEAKLEEILPQLVNLSPRGILEVLDLARPIYEPTSAYGHFGREAKDGFFTWERLDLVDKLKSAF